MEENKNLCKVKYDSKNDRFCLMLSTSNGMSWDLHESYQLISEENQESVNFYDKPAFVSIELILELKRIISQGYTMVC